MENFDYLQMLAGELYIARDVAEVCDPREGREITRQINQTNRNDREKIKRLVGKIVAHKDDNYWITPPVYVDYEKHITVGSNFYCNLDCIFLDVNKITIGDNVMVGPRVSFYTAGHPTDAEIRNEALEFGLPITVKDNVWIGGNVVILPGVTIGKNSIVAAGAVVTKDVPDNVIVGGNPARVIREIGEADKAKWERMKDTYYRKKKEFEER